MPKGRVAVPFSPTEVSSFEACLPMLQRDSELWRRIVVRMLGRPTIPVGLGTLSTPPSSVPQLVNVLAGVGLRVMEDIEADLMYEKLAGKVDGMRRALDVAGMRRREALKSDGIST